MSYSFTSRLFAAALLALGVGTAACTESTVFIPLEPSQQSARLTEALDSLYARFPVQPDSLNAGRFGTVSGFVVYQGEAANGFFVVDWSSSNNNVVVRVHRTGDAGVLDAPLVRDNCSLPSSISSGGSPINEPRPIPLCPIVGGASNAKPWFFALDDIPPGQYEITVGNLGPGNETIRNGFFEN